MIFFNVELKTIRLHKRFFFWWCIKNLSSDVAWKIFLLMLSKIIRIKHHNHYQTLWIKKQKKKKQVYSYPNYSWCLMFHIYHLYFFLNINIKLSKPVNLQAKLNTILTFQQQMVFFSTVFHKYLPDQFKKSLYIIRLKNWNWNFFFSEVSKAMQIFLLAPHLQTCDVG